MSLGVAKMWVKGVQSLPVSTVVVLFPESANKSDGTLTKDTLSRLI